MADKWANIDLVFRNGLKDFEVLPPPDVWDNIHPVVKIRPKSYLLLSAAASVAVIVTAGFFAYRLTRDISPGLENSILALNNEAATPGNYFSIVKPATITVKEKNSAPVISEKITAYSSGPETEEIASTIASPFPETGTLTSDNKSLVKGPNLASLNAPQESTFKINELYQQLPESNYKPEVKERWSIAAMASPTYYSKFSSGTDDLSKMLDASEQPLISYSGGVAFSYKLSKRFSIQSGLYYSSLGKVVDNISSFTGFRQYDVTKNDHNFEVLSASGTIYTDNRDVYLISTGQDNRVKTAYNIDVFDPKKASLQPVSNSLRQNFSYLEVPVVLRYKLVDKMLDLNLVGGFSYDILVKNSVFTLTDGVKNPVGKTAGLNTLSLSSSLGMGMEYSFSDKLSMNLEPTFRYYLNPFDELSISKIHPYSFGIFSGVSYKF
jgi:hypothetical protein